MNKQILTLTVIIISIILLPIKIHSQTNIPGVCYDKSCATPNDKAGSFSNAYTNTQCGLNYAIGGVKLTQRATWQPGVGQPATININTIPICVNPSQGHILRAYIYWIVEGGPITGNVTLTNPASATASFSGTMIGNIAGGKCWNWGIHVILELMLLVTLQVMVIMLLAVYLHQLLIMVQGIQMEPL